MIVGLLIGSLSLMFIFGFLAKNNGGSGNSNNLVSCLAEAGMVIYGSRTCPACTALADSFGGYEKIKEIYVECTEEQERCGLEMQTNYVPEIQIKGEVYNDPRDLESLAEVTNCK